MNEDTIRDEIEIIEKHIYDLKDKISDSEKKIPKLKFDLSQLQTTRERVVILFF